MVVGALAGKIRTHEDYVGLLTGEFFRSRNLSNLAEPDFFGWALETKAERSFVGFLSSLDHHLGVYDFSNISEDILKEVYQELVDPESRHALGEYYTPDWLADLTLERLNYSTGTVLDPACGSGSFLLAAIRRKRKQGLKGPALLKFGLNSVLGIDVHPLAVLMAKANLILAMVKEMRQANEDIYLPIYMADSLLVSEDTEADRIEVQVSEDETFYIPLATLRNKTDIDQLVDRISRAARVSKGSEKKKQNALKGLLKGELSSMHPKEQFYWQENFKLMSTLIDQDRDTIYGYILKNAHRPAFIRQDKVDYIVGNPPWLAYRYIDDKGYRKRIKDLTFALGLLGRRLARLFTQMDTSTLFFLYCEREFLKPRGTIAFVLPKTTVIPAKQHLGFQSHGFSEIHDFTEVSPLFNVRAVLVVRGPDVRSTSDIPSYFYKARLDTKNLTWDAARIQFDFQGGTYSFLDAGVRSPEYYNRFFQGATIVPRCMWFVQPQKGAAKNRKAPHLETSDEAYEEAKEQWKLRMKGQVEARFLYETVLAKGLLPFAVSRREPVFLPLRIVADSYVIADSSVLVESRALHAAEWMTRAEKTWDSSRKGRDDVPLHKWLNYGQKITAQRPDAKLLVLYNTSGTNLTAAVLEADSERGDGNQASGFVADAKTYYCYPRSRSEGLYLVSVLNSDVVNDLIKVYQPQGLYGERDIHRRPFEVCAIPKFDSSSKDHMRLAELAERCAIIVSKHTSGMTGKLGNQRLYAKALVADEISEINKIVSRLLEAGGQTQAEPVKRMGWEKSLELFPE